MKNMIDCWQTLVHLPRKHSLVDWYDQRIDDDDDAEDENVYDDERRSDLSTPHDDVPTAARERILMEIVGVMGLESKQRRTVDPCCTVQVYDDKNRQWKMVHRTDTIHNDGNPIWTVKTKSLCLVEVPVARPERQEASRDVTNTMVATTELIGEDDITKGVVIDVCHASTKLCRVCIPYTEMLRHSNNFYPERVEFRTKAIPGHATLSAAAVLALRFRIATEQDLVFLYKQSEKKVSVRELTRASIHLNHNPAERASFALSAQPQNDVKVAADINFHGVTSKSFFQRHQQTDSDGHELFRVIPYPDPDRPAEETEWISAADIERTAYQPSTHWVTAGCGSIGKLYLEVIGCDNLPQMDADLSSTDAFVAMALEDNFLRTDVIWDRLSPRWMPWTTRAFQFNIRHPASLLFLSVFDFDGLPLDKHDHIGRVVLQPSSFRSGMTYTLHYPLQDHPTKQSYADSPMSGDVSAVSTKSANFARGIITLRLRMEWENESEATKLYFTRPQRFIINVDNEKAYDVLCYTTRGAIFMDEPSLQSVQVLAHEIMSYWKNCCFTFDVMTEILLWRGRCKVTEHTTIWFPVHSMVVLVVTVLLVERPHLTMPVLLYAAAWFLLSMHYHSSHHPNPWLRVPSNLEVSTLMTFGRRSLISSSGRGSCPTEIAANQNFEAGVQQEKLDAMKAARMSALIHAVLLFGLKVYRIYWKTGDSAINITTERRNWNFLSDRLYYLHKLLLVICQNLRLGKNFLNWKNNYTAVFTTYCIMLATAWLIFPVSTILRWLVRVLVWTILSPWMKFVDIKYFRPWYLTKDELLERIRNHSLPTEPDLPDFDRVFQSEIFGKMIHAGRVKAEDLHKLRDMRTLLFGSYSEAIPVTDNSLYPSVPYPQSTALRTEAPARNAATASRGYHVPGQLLTGNMVLATTVATAQYTNNNEQRKGESKNDPSVNEKKKN